MQFCNFIIIKIIGVLAKNDALFLEKGRRSAEDGLW
jgi:hypothetical protein